MEDFPRVLQFVVQMTVRESIALGHSREYQFTLGRNPRKIGPIPALQSLSMHDTLLQPHIKSTISPINIL